MTTATRPRRLPKLNRDRIRQEEQAHVARALRGARLPATRLKLSSALVASAEQTIEEHRAARDEAALSLALYDGKRAVDGVIGVHRSNFYGMRQRALNLTDEEKAAHWLEWSTPPVRRDVGDLIVQVHMRFGVLLALDDVADIASAKDLKEVLAARLRQSVSDFPTDDVNDALLSFPGVRRSKDQVAARARAEGVPYVADAGALAVEHGEIVARADERAAAARAIRDAAIIELSKKNRWASPAIAKVAGLAESRIRQITGDAPDDADTVRKQRWGNATP